MANHFKLLFIIFIFHFQNGLVSSQNSKIHPDLASRLDKGEKLNVLVTFANGVRSALSTVTSQRHADRGSRNTAIVTALKQNVDSTQQDVVQMLSTRSGSGGFSYFRQYWTSNKMFVREADASTIQSIAENPQVKRIQLESNMKIPDITNAKQAKSGLNEDPHYAGWNLNKINLTAAWNELGGNKGEGVVVGIIDSGALHTHNTLRDNFLGPYGWYDPVNGTLEPHDPDGHGTACLSVMAGGEYRPNETTGVAPSAKWMACKGCGAGPPGDECLSEHILSCIQFMSCPTLADGSNPDCSKIPQVLSFSIGGKRDGEDYDDDFLTMKELGIIPVAATGNEGTKSRCGTSKSPANMPFVIAVGGSTLALEGYDELWGGGSRGPSPNGTIKPELLAPSTSILSAYIENNRSTASRIGTSLATPHVAGVVALLHVRNPNLTFEEAVKFVTETANKDVKTFLDQFCNDSLADSIPNNSIGHGLLNAHAALQAQTAAMKAKV